MGIPPIYQTANHFWLAATYQLVNAGADTPTRHGGSKELIGWCGKIADPTRSIITVDARKWSPGYACAELLWYLMGRDDTAMMAAYAPRYYEFGNDGQAMGAYGARWRHNPGISSKGGGRSSLQVAYEILKKNPDDRRAVVTMFDSGDAVEAKLGEWRDIPCTMTMQFLLRAGKLNMILSMRSNDVWLGTPYDVFCFTQIQCLMAAALGVEVGVYTHVCGSLHLYDKNDLKAVVALNNGFEKREDRVPMPSHELATEYMETGFPPRWVMSCEEALRMSPQAGIQMQGSSPRENWWWDLLACCARKLGRNVNAVPAWAVGETP